MKNKALALFLALCMVLAMLPATANAAQPQPEAAGKMVPAAVGTLQTAAVSPNASSYRVTLTSSGKGEAELLVDSPAKVGSEVYFLANPDDGYLAEVYYEGLDEDDLVYIGADVIGFIMPANKVTLEVKFVAAQGSSHDIEVYENGGVGEYALSRYQAKAYESVLLAVAPRDNESFEPEGFVWVSGAPAFYLFEQEGVHYYEIIMGSENVNVFLCYTRSGPFSIGTWLDGDPFGGTVTVSPERAYVNDLVTVTIKPNPGFHLVSAKAVSYAGDLISELAPIGNDQYVFRMHPAGVELHVIFEAEEKNVTVKAGPGGTAYTNVTRTKVGTDVTLTCVPDSNYRVDKITGVDGLKEDGENVYWFSMPARDVTINVTFKAIYNPVNVTVENGLGGQASADLTEAKAGDTVTLTVSPDEGYRIARITGVKDLTDNGDGTYTFTMPDEAVAIRVLFLRHDNPFFDLNEYHFFYDSVLWAVEEGITSGLTPTQFGPFEECNRAQVVTFLWRYAGSPEPETAVNPFIDVPAREWYAKAVLWAVENGITNGISATEFGPGQPCNRAQVVTFLWRYLGEPESKLTEHPFTDVPAREWYAKAVLWAVENGITNGADATHFNPNGKCQRAQVVTFLHRTAQLPPPPVVYALSTQFDAEMGTVTLSHTSAQAGEVITATVIPAEGYELVNVHCLNDTGITVVSDTKFTFVMPAHEETFVAVFAPIATEPSEPEKPVKTYELDLRDNGNGKVAYVDGKTTAAPGESIFFYAIPNQGYYLDHVGIFNPNNEINTDLIQVHEHGEGLYELVMIDHDIIMTCYFYPIS